MLHLTRLIIFCRSSFSSAACTSDACNFPRMLVPHSLSVLINFIHVFFTLRVSSSYLNHGPYFISN